MSGILPSMVQAFDSLPDYSGHSLGFLLEVSFKGTLFLLFALTSVLALRRASAATRHLVWTLAVNAMLALPIVALTVPSWNFATLPSWSAGIASGRSSTSQDLKAGEPNHQNHPIQPARLPASAEFQMAAHPAWPRWVLLIWAIGAVLFASRIAVGVIRVRGLTRRAPFLSVGPSNSVVESVRVRLRIIRPVKVQISSEIAIPFTWGVFHPTVFLPEAGQQWPGKHLEFVLAHELAHVRRFDYLTQMASQLACALFWFHPLVWLAACQISHERERACDDLVLSLDLGAIDYAEFLVLLSRGFGRLNAGWLATVALTQSSQLEVRMKALLDSELNHKPIAASRALLGTALAVALLLPVAAMRATAKNTLGTVSGTVHDPSGAVVPDAEVTLVNIQTQQKIVGQTGEDGAYRFPGVMAGRYRLEIDKAGFARARSAELELQPSSGLHQDITIDVGPILQQVVVHGHKPVESAPLPPAPSRIRVGGLVQAGHLISQQKPEYPSSLQKQGIEGTVVLRAVIGMKGEILALSPISGPDPVLIKAAMDAVRQWRYQPTLLNGAPVEVATTIEVSFQLEN